MSKVQLEALDQALQVIFSTPGTQDVKVAAVIAAYQAANLDQYLVEIKKDDCERLLHSFAEYLFAGLTFIHEWLAKLSFGVWVYKSQIVEKPTAVYNNCCESRKRCHNPCEDPCRQEFIPLWNNSCDTGCDTDIIVPGCKKEKRCHKKKHHHKKKKCCKKGYKNNLTHYYD